MDNVRIRIKLADGSEFEAEGPERFILSERKAFMEKLCPDADNKDGAAGSQEDLPQQPSTKHETEPETHQENDYIEKDLLFDTIPEHKSIDFNKHEPDNKYIDDNVLIGRNCNADNSITIWNKITKESKKGNRIIVSRPSSLSAQDAVLLLLAAEYNINGIRSMSALAISKMVKSSGFHHSRLDRLLNAYICSGFLRFEGTKRNRLYSITEKGFQQAALLAHALFSSEI